MSTVGIVCEYNPFHKGHEYQIQQAKLLTGAEHVICFMSGNFLQRGVPAIADKHTRTEIALRCGVDAVFEIPFVYASSSARDYAHAAVCMMNALDGIDYISFGAECDDMDLLQKIAELTVTGIGIHKKIRIFWHLIWISQSSRHLRVSAEPEPYRLYQR